MNKYWSIEVVSVFQYFYSPSDKKLVSFMASVSAPAARKQGALGREVYFFDAEASKKQTSLPIPLIEPLALSGQSGETYQFYPRKGISCL